MAVKEIKKSNWVSSFTLTGAAKISNYTYKIDEQKEGSDWVYSSMNLGVDCGEKHGVVYADMMGGFSASGNSKIYVHGKNEDGTDNFDNRFEVDWDDRNNPEILDTIGRMSFLTVGIEETSNKKTFYKNFLSAYDAINYCKDFLKDGMVITVKGNIKYSTYNGNVTVNKNITSIALSKAEDSSKYKATFTQTILVDKDSAPFTKDNIDKDKGVIYVNARVLDYVKEINGVEIKGNYPFAKTFEYALPSDAEKAKKAVNVLFGAKKNITQITMNGNFIEGGAVKQITLDDIPDDIKALINIGVFSEEEALEKCAVNGNREQRMVFTTPYIKNVKNGDDVTPVLQKFDDAFKEEDLDFSEFFNKADNNALDEYEEILGDEESDNFDWLSKLD